MKLNVGCSIWGGQQKEHTSFNDMLFENLLLCSIDASAEPGDEGAWMGRLVNHGKGKETNSRAKIMKVGGKPCLALFATRSIKVNEELLYDYGVKKLPWMQVSA